MTLTVSPTRERTLRLALKRDRFWLVEESAIEGLLEQADYFLSQRLSAPNAAFNPFARDESEQVTYSLKDGIAHLEMHGLFVKSGDCLSSLLGEFVTSEAKAAVYKALEDPSVRGMMLHIDSPGGQAAGTGDLADAVAAFAEEKPVVAYCEDLCASAAYWVASQATAVHMNPTGLLGSIGVYTTLYDLSKRAEGQGIQLHVVRRGEFKGLGIPYAPVTDATLSEAQRLVDLIGDQFEEAVIRGRGESERKTLQSAANGRLYGAEEARTLKLADAVMPYHESLARLKALTGK